MLKHVKPLHDLGFAVHLLKERSKLPLNSGWSTRPRDTWANLKASFRPGMNLGVRLGKVSKLENGYLAVIDCDVKSGDGKYALEMKDRLDALVGSLVDAAPVVHSGRGNGSLHLYVVTSEPVRAQRLAQSKDRVKLKMPSASPSKFELETLTKDEIRAGIRIRPAWEISLMGEGQQVVLPPSIHPDSGRPYVWWREIGEQALPEFKVEQKKETEIDTSAFKFEPVDVDLVGSKLSSTVVDLIISGDGCEDRSAALLRAGNAMAKAGFTEMEMLSVLTDRGYFLGEAGFDHAKTEDRSRAARWIKRYTVDKARRESAAEEAFKDEVDVDDAPTLSDKEAAAQLADLVVEADWTEELERSKDEGRLKNTLRNTILILQGVGGSNVFKRDEFANAEIYGCDTPWGGSRGAEIADIDTVRIKHWLATRWRFEPSNDRINEAVSKIADLNRFHPVRDYLDGLEWDGKARLDTWLKRLLNAEAPEPYLSAVSRKTIVAMIARVYEPGVKYDQVLILEGNQGRGKSRALNALAGDGWFTDAQINVGDKDAVLTMRSIWLVELGELSSMSKADVELLKAFISTRTDRIRVPYGKRTENFPRQCIFIGSTNQKEYLKDTTGNRRYWPVKVGVCNVEAVKAERDQLFAEAKFAYDLGEPLWLEEMEAETGALKEQESRGIHDAWEDLIADWIIKGQDGSEDEGVTPRVDRARFRTEDLFEPSGPLGDWKLNPPELKRCGETLRKMGFESVSVYDRSTKRTRRFWSKTSRPHA